MLFQSQTDYYKSKTKAIKLAVIEAHILQFSEEQKLAYLKIYRQNPYLIPFLLIENGIKTVKRISAIKKKYQSFPNEVFFEKGGYTGKLTSEYPSKFKVMEYRFRNLSRQLGISVNEVKFPI